MNPEFNPYGFCNAHNNSLYKFQPRPVSFFKNVYKDIFSVYLFLKISEITLNNVLLEE